jgi:hypothetical protein
MLFCLYFDLGRGIAFRQPRQTLCILILGIIQAFFVKRQEPREENDLARGA